MGQGSLVALMLAVLPAAAQGETLEGRVVEDHTGNPLVAVGVRIRRAGAAVLAADLETTADGRFRAPDVPLGEYLVDLSKANYVSTRLRLRLPAAAPLIRLVRTGVITGRVIRPDGRPPRGGQVFAMVKPPGDVPWQRSTLFAAVDGTGQYRLHGLPPGRYAVALSYATFNPGGTSGAYFYPDNAQPRLFTISGGEELGGIDFVTPAGPLYSVSGTVVAPVPGTMFAVSLYHASHPGVAVSNLWTKGDGSFRLEGIAPGSYELAVAGPATGYGMFTSSVGPEPLFGRLHLEVGGADVEGLSIPVARGRSATLLLRGGDGCPSTATIRLVPLEATGSGERTGIELSAGKERKVGDLPPGRYQVLTTVSGDECFASSSTIDLTAGDAPGPLPVELKLAGLIRGRLVANVPSGFTVLLLAVDERDAVRAAYPDEAGRFTFQGLRPGRYRIAAAANGRWLPDFTRMFEIEVPGGSTTEVDLSPPRETEGTRP